MQRDTAAARQSYERHGLPARGDLSAIPTVSCKGKGEWFAQNTRSGKTGLGPGPGKIRGPIARLPAGCEISCEELLITFSCILFYKLKRHFALLRPSFNSSSAQSTLSPMSVKASSPKLRSIPGFFQSASRFESYSSTVLKNRIPASNPGSAAVFRTARTRSFNEVRHLFMRECIINGRTILPSLPSGSIFHAFHPLR